MHRARVLVGGVLAAAPIVLSAPAAASVAGPVGAPYPPPAVCVDSAAVLDAPTCARITRVLDAGKRATTDEIAVVVVPTTGGISIETWGTGLFNSWGVGQRGRNNGVSLVVATDDQRLRIVTGSGLTDRLPDDTASEIIEGTITPLFKDGRVRDGVLAGLDEIRRHLGHQVNDTNQLAEPGMAPIPAAPDPSEPVWLSAAVLVVLVALIGGVGYMVLTGNQWFWDRFDSGSASSHSAGSSGSSTFGGGSSSGGGASGSW